MNKYIQTSNIVIFMFCYAILFVGRENIIESVEI